LKAILDAALTAGKAARDPNQVPELEPLRRYGSGNSRYSSEAPANLSQAAAKAAMKLAIEPAVRICVANFQARKQSYAIVNLRQQVEQMGKTREEIKWLNQQLHQPTMDLRKGLEVDKCDLLVTLESELQAIRSETLESTHIQ
jgi:type IV secretory pathway VirJ component